MSHRPVIGVVLGMALTLLLVCGCGSTQRSGVATKAVTSTTAPASSAAPFPTLVASVRTGVVRVEATTCVNQGVGTGFLITPHLVVTVEHVVDGATRLTLKQNGHVVGSGTVIGADAARDVALVRSDRPISGYRFHLASRAPQLGESVAALGFPLGLPLTVTRGSVSGLNRAIPIQNVLRRRLVQTDAAVNPGNSGGPLITDTGTVVGLVDLGTNQANGLAFAVSASVAKPLLDAWAASPQPITASGCASQTPSSQAAPPPPAAASPAGPSGYLYGVTHDVIVRDGPRTSANQLGLIPAGSMVGVQCKTIGEVISGPYGNDPNWDYVTYNGTTGYVTDQWIDTKQDESNPAMIPLC